MFLGGKTLNTIDSVVIHKLVKERHGKATVITRPATLKVTEPVQKLVHDIHDLYADRTGKGYGRFHADEINYPASRILRETFKAKSKSFIDASRDLMNVLATKAGQAPLATGGYVLMAQVTNPAKVSWFIVAIITNIKGSAINDESLEVVDSVHVDLHNLRVAGRVNLTDWLKDEKDVRYVGFLKQKGEVSDYFKLFLGCDELIASTEETKKLVAVLKEFAKNSGLKPEQQEDFLTAAHDHCSECQKNDQPLILEALTNAVWPNDPKALQKALTTGDVQISDGFVPDGRSLKTLVKIKAKTPYWSVELDRRALITGQAKYDSNKHTLTLTNLPENLEAELRGEFD
jgi:nucleoid-associated protein